MQKFSEYTKKGVVVLTISAFVVVSFFGNNLQIAKADLTGVAAGPGAQLDTGLSMDILKELGLQKKAGEKLSFDKASTKAGEKAVAAAKVKTDAMTGSGKSCTSKCPGGTWAWKVSANIRNAICEMQCTIIDWESGMIGWVIARVLYPALGICDEGTSACPTPPATSTTDPGATSGTGGAGSSGGGGAGGAGSSSSSTGGGGGY